MAKTHIAALIALASLGLGYWATVSFIDWIYSDPLEWYSEYSMVVQQPPQQATETPRELFTPELLQAMHQVETDGDCTLVGDVNTTAPAYGCFQIRLALHPGVTRACAESYQCSSAYLVRFLTSERERLGLSDDDTIRRWNGLPAGGWNRGYLLRVKSKLMSL